jgi:hypothetical protein
MFHGRKKSFPILKFYATVCLGGQKIPERYGTVRRRFPLLNVNESVTEIAP